MKKYLMILAGSMVLASSAAMAYQPRPQDNQDQHTGNPHDRHDQQRQDQHGRAAPQDNRGRYGGDHKERGYYVSHDRGQHGGWYKRGGRMPAQYRDTRYVVSDWRADHLREPPRGYHWVRGDNNQFLLVAITSGVIANILLSH